MEYPKGTDHSTWWRGLSRKLGGRCSRGHWQKLHLVQGWGWARGRVSKESKDMQGTVTKWPRIGHSWPSKELLTDLDFTKQNFKKQVMRQRRIQKRNNPLLSSSFHKWNNSLADQGHCLRIKATNDTVSLYFSSFCCRPMAMMPWAGTGLHFGAGSPQSSGQVLPLQRGE